MGGEGTPIRMVVFLQGKHWASNFREPVLGRHTNQPFITCWKWWLPRYVPTILRGHQEIRSLKRSAETCQNVPKNPLDWVDHGWPINVSTVPPVPPVPPVAVFVPRNDDPKWLRLFHGETMGHGCLDPWYQPVGQVNLETMALKSTHPTGQFSRKDQFMVLQGHMFCSI